MKIRSAVLMILALAAAAAGVFALFPGALTSMLSRAPKHSVLLVTLDTTRADHLR